MLMLFRHTRPGPYSAMRGGTFFTMLIFVMLLISTALMYYYFQRTQSLQRELTQLKSGLPVDSDDDSGFFDWLPWNNSEQDNEVTAVTSQPPPAPVKPEPVEATPVKPSYDESQIYEPGAVSTPRPTPVDAVQSHGAPAGRLNLGSVSTQSLEVNAADVSAPVEEQIEKNDATEDSPAEPADPPQESREPIRSMYDELPPVRVRSPRQSRE